MNITLILWMLDKFRWSWNAVSVGPLSFSLHFSFLFCFNEALSRFMFASFFSFYFYLRNILNGEFEWRNLKHSVSILVK